MPETSPATPEKGAKQPAEVTDVSTAQQAILGLMEPPRPPESTEIEKKQETKPKDNPKAKTQPEVEGDAATPMGTDEGEQEAPEEQDGTELPEAAAQEGTVDTATTDDTAQAEGRPPETITELAEILGVDIDELRKSLRDTVTIDGETSELSLHEIRRGQLREADYTRKTTEIAKQREALEAERHAKHSELEQQSARMAGLVIELEKAIVRDADMDWEQLREDDATEYIKRKEALRERKELLDAALKEQSQREQQRQQEFQQKVALHVQEQRNKLLMHLPEWGDPTKAEPEQKQLNAYLSAQGFGQNEINSIFDHRQVLIARKAMLYDKERQNVNKASLLAKKKVAMVPKMQEPGTTQNKPTVNEQAIADKRKRLHRSGKVDDAASLFLEIME